METAGALQSVGDVAAEGAGNFLDGIRFFIDLTQSSQFQEPGAASASPSPAWVTTLIDVPASADAFFFDYEFVSGASALLSVELEGQQIYVADQAFTDSGVQSVSIQFAQPKPPGLYSVAFRVDLEGTGTTEVLVSNVGFASVTSPPQHSLPVRPWVVLGAVLVIGWMGIRTSRRSRHRS